MSQWLDVQASNSIGSTVQVDTSRIGYGVASDSKIMLYLTAAGVLLAALALLKKGR